MKFEKRAMTESSPVEQMDTLIPLPLRSRPLPTLPALLATKHY